MIIEGLFVVMTSSNSPPDGSIDAVRGTELLSRDHSKKTASFSSSKIVYYNSGTTGNTQFLELESKLQKEETFKKRKPDGPYIFCGFLLFFFFSGGSFTDLKILWFNSPFSNPEY